MRFKLDENLGTRGAVTLRAAGHDVATVVEQGLTSASDATLIRVCSDEGRCLVTLDLDFANTLRFPPGRYAGIAVLRLADRATAAELDRLVRELATAVAGASVAGKLWIVEAGRVREYAPQDD